MTKLVGTLLRALSAVWTVFAVLRILAGLTGATRGEDLILGLAALVIAIATFKFGTWLKNRQPGPPLAQRLDRVQSGWWRAEHGFRLAVFLAGVWVVAAFLWQDEYDRNWGLLLWPPVGLLAAYYGYRRFVVTNAEHLVSKPSPQAEASPASPATPVVDARASTVNERVLWAAIGLAAVVALAIIALRMSFEPPEKGASAPQSPPAAPVGLERPPVEVTEKGSVDPNALAAYVNSRFGFKVSYPQGVLFPQGESANGDGQVFTSRDAAFVLTAWGERKAEGSSVEELFAYESRGLVQPNPNLVVSYKRRKDNWFVVSGTEGSVGIYRRVQIDSDHITRIEMRWPIDQIDRWRPTIEKVSIAPFSAR